MKKRMLGIDEAGRGGVLGPMVVAGVTFDQEGLDKLGIVKDSKAYGSGPSGKRTRERLAALIREYAIAVDVRLVSSNAIDKWRETRTLNELERFLAEEIINPQQDVKDLSILADGKSVFGLLENVYSNISVEDNAEDLWLPVAAASIVAKTERDLAVERIYADLGFTSTAGGGYPNPKTEALLRKYVKENRDLPDVTRRSWSWTRKRFHKFL